MTPKDAFTASQSVDPRERQWRYQQTCQHRGFCYEQLLDGPCRFSWCPDCLTLYDDNGRIINQIPSLAWSTAR
jgi:hypothetical protein